MLATGRLRQGFIRPFRNRPITPSGQVRDGTGVVMAVVPGIRRRAIPS